MRNRGVAMYTSNYCIQIEEIVDVTVYGKTRHIGISVKIKFDVSLISSTLELTHLQV